MLLPVFTWRQPQKNGSAMAEKALKSSAINVKQGATAKGHRLNILWSKTLYYWVETIKEAVDLISTKVFHCSQDFTCSTANKEVICQVIVYYITMSTTMVKKNWLEVQIKESVFLLGGGATYMSDISVLCSEPEILL